jgi:hypothetical protein
MKSMNRIQRAAMGALVAAVLMVGVGEASAAVRRFPADTPSYLLPLGRAKVVNDGSGGIMARLKAMLAAVRIFPEGGVQILRFPAKAQRNG